MNRLLKELGNTDSLNVLINNEETLLLLLKNRHVRYEKTNVKFLVNNKPAFETTSAYLKPSDVVQLTAGVIPDLYVTDISNIELTNEEYVISIDPECLVYYGSFKVKLINKGI